MSSLNLAEEIRSSIEGRIECSEQLLGKGAMIPFNSVDSGSRKLMYNVQVEQRLPLINPQVPVVETGYEDQFGEYSSSFRKMPEGATVLDRIEKFSNKPGYHFYLICETESHRIMMIERVSYKHINESYGYQIDNEIIDHFKPGDYICKDTVIHKSTSFSKENNRCDGTNLMTAYLATEFTMEDGIVISEDASVRLASPLFKQVEITVNDNDIPLNIYGDDTHYKPLPNIGEENRNGILYAQRREKKEDCLYMQSYSRLSSILMSDDKYTVPKGIVIDIDIAVNNVEKLTESEYYQQFNELYLDKIRFCKEIVTVVGPFINNKNYTVDHELKELYYNSKYVLDGRQYIYSEKVFSNIQLKVTVMEVKNAKRGDKLSNRHGGKGVISKVMPTELMPILPNGQRVELIFNQATVTNRENGGQLFEISLAYIGRKLIEHIEKNNLGFEESVDIYLRYIKLVSEKLYNYINDYLSSVSDDVCLDYIGSVIADRDIYLSIDPMSESMTLDKLALIYKEFPFIEPEYVMMPITNSNGQVRFVKSRRPLVVANEYIYRMKQSGEEKFSVTSLSSTNIRNENSRNKANNVYKALFAKTPIKQGDMEMAQLNHLGPEIAVEMLMLYSTSPHARRLTESMLTGDPFNIDVKLDEDSSNRNVEILNAYFKAAGLRLVFKRVPKKIALPFYIDVLQYFPKTEPLKRDVVFVEDPNLTKEENDKKFEESKSKSLIIPMEISHFTISKEPKEDDRYLYVKDLSENR